MEVIGAVSGVVGVLAFTFKLAGEVTVLVADIRNAPEDIIQLRTELQDLSDILDWIQILSGRHQLRPEDKPLEVAVITQLKRCKNNMEDIKQKLKRFFKKGSERRGPLQIISWRIRKGEIRDLKDKLRDSRAQLQLSVLVLNAHLSGKGQHEIMSEMKRGMKSLRHQIQSAEGARRLQEQLEGVVETVYKSSVGGPGVRRPSLSSVTDAANELPFKLRMFLGNAESLAPATVDGDELNAKDTPLMPPDGETSQPVLEATSPLLQAATAGNTVYVRALLMSFGASPSARDRDGRTALHICAIHGHATTAGALIENGADVDAKDRQSRSPFRTAIVNRSFGVATLLLQGRCDLPQTIVRDLLGVLAIEDEADSASVPGYKEYLDALRHRLDASDSRGPFLAHEAIEQNDDAGLHRLLKAGFDPMVPDENGISPLHHAILRKKRETVVVLLQHGADPNEFLSPETHTRLRADIPWHAALYGRGQCGNMPISSAAHCALDPDMVLLLLKAGADPNKLHTDGAIVLESICAGNFIESAKHMIDFGANINNADGTAIHWAIICGNFELLRYMIVRGGIELDRACPKHGWHRMPLHTAVLEKNGDMVTMLVNAGSNLHARDSHGRRPIDLIDEGSDFDYVRRFLAERMGIQDGVVSR